MSVEETRVIVGGFLDGQASQWLAEDADLCDTAGTGDRRGRPDITAWFGRWTEVAPRPGWLLVGDGYAAAELALVGAERVVRAVAIFEVKGGEIVHLRLYYDLISMKEPPDAGSGSMCC